LKANSPLAMIESDGQDQGGVEYVNVTDEGRIGEACLVGLDDIGSRLTAILGSSGGWAYRTLLTWAHSRVSLQIGFASRPSIRKVPSGTAETWDPEP
jgi:hypothetical protein